MQEQDRSPHLLDAGAEAPDAVAYREIEQAEIERREKTKLTLFWAVGVPFGGLAAALAAFALHLSVEDFLCVWVICAGLVYGVLSPAIG